MSGIPSIVKDAIDMHYHIGPDILSRKDTVESLLKNEKGKITGIALKSHAFPTISAINTIENQNFLFNRFNYFKLFHGRI